MPSFPFRRRPAARLAPVAALAAAALAAACGSDPAAPAAPVIPPGPDGSLIPAGGTVTIARYLDIAFDSIQTHSINQSKNWTVFRARWEKAGYKARTYRETYPYIDSALAELDPHSSISTPDNLPGSTDAPVDRPDLRVSGRLIAPRIGYLWVPGFIGRSQVARVDSTHDIIRTLDQGQPCGWIVDVRANNGGFFYALLASVGPLYQTGNAALDVTAGGLRYNNGELRWFYRDNRFGVTDGRAFDYFSGTRPYTPQRLGLPVAVLQGQSRITLNGRIYGSITASAGEAIALSFRGGPPSRSFGQPTYGVASGREPIFMPDNARIDITDSYMFARNGFEPRDAPIQPEQPVTGFATSYTGDENDPVVQAAVAWLNAQPACTGTAGGGTAADLAPRAASLPPLVPPAAGEERGLPGRRAVFQQPAAALRR